MRPLPSKNGPGGPCDPQPNTKNRKRQPVSKRARATARALTRAQGGFDDPGVMPRTTTGPPFLVCVKKAANTTEGENKKQQKKSNQNTLAASRPEKGPQKGRVVSNPQSTEKIRQKRQNARGPERHPDKTPEKKDARPEGVIKRRGGDKNKEKKTDQKSA